MEPCQKRISDGGRSLEQRQAQPPPPPPLDRLSNLPDCLLLLILNELPIDVAVATSLLSSRWLNLWTHITHISLPPDTPNFYEFEYFKTTIDHILPQLASRKIHTFHLEFNFHRSTNPDEGEVAASEEYRNFLLPWFEQVCLRNPETIKVDFRTDPWKSTNLFNVATCVFNCQSLVCLKLYLDFESDDLLPADMLSLISLPNLKKLCMYLRDQTRVLMGLLFKCCPLLEELKLFMELAEPDHLINISAPNLKRLYIKLDENDEEVVTENCKFVIDAPKLDTLTIEGYLAFYEFVNKPSKLKNVRISIQEICFHDRNFDTYTRQVMGLLQRISCARSLILDECGCHLLYCIHMLEEITLDGIHPPIFHKLNSLSFASKFEGQKFPTCFLVNLKMLEILDLECYELEIKLLQHILSNAPVMEEIHLSVYPDHGVGGSEVDDETLEEEYEYCKEIFMLPRSSPVCLIEFYGQVIEASSADLEDGVLNYRLKE